MSEATVNGIELILDAISFMMVAVTAIFLAAALNRYRIRDSRSVAAATEPKADTDGLSPMEESAEEDARKPCCETPAGEAPSLSLRSGIGQEARRRTWVADIGFPPPCSDGVSDTISLDSENALNDPYEKVLRLIGEGISTQKIQEKVRIPREEIELAVKLYHYGASGQEDGMRFA